MSSFARDFEQSYFDTGLARVRAARLYEQLGDGAMSLLSAKLQELEGAQADFEVLNELHGLIQVCEDFTDWYDDKDGVFELTREAYGGGLPETMRDEFDAACETIRSQTPDQILEDVSMHAIDQATQNFTDRIADMLKTTWHRLNEVAPEGARKRG
jgi:hypothetical protein